MPVPNSLIFIAFSVLAYTISPVRVIDDSSHDGMIAHLFLSEEYGV